MFKKDSLKQTKYAKGSQDKERKEMSDFKHGKSNLGDVKVLIESIEEAGEFPKTKKRSK